MSWKEFAEFFQYAPNFIDTIVALLESAVSFLLQFIFDLPKFLLPFVFAPFIVSIVYLIIRVIRGYR